MIGCLTSSQQSFLSMVTTNYISMRWGGWCLLCTRPTQGSLIFILLAHWNNSLLMNMSLHLDILSWFWTKQSLFLPLDATCLAEKQQYQYYSVVWPDRGSNTQSNTPEASTLAIIQGSTMRPKHSRVTFVKCE